MTLEEFDDMCRAPDVAELDPQAGGRTADVGVLR